MMFKRLFPEVNPINKFHHLYHYPESILWTGPIAQYNCIRFETKHAELKLRAQNINHFKNATKTLVRISQCIQSSKWGAFDVNLHRFVALHGSTELVENTLSRIHLNNLGYVDTYVVFCSSSVRVDGTEYQRRLFVCLQVAHTWDYNLPLFGRMSEIIVLQGSDIFLQTSICSSYSFYVNFNAFCIEIVDDNCSHRFIRVSDLAHFKPVCCWGKANSEDLSISLRHILLWNIISFYIISCIIAGKEFCLALSTLIVFQTSPSLINWLNLIIYYI